MSPYDELLATGQFGETNYSLLFELTRQELRKFPVLGYNASDAIAVWDAAHSFLVERGSAVTTMLLTQASDDDSLGALLRKSLYNWLVDQVRKTDLGALRRRLDRVISEDDRFEVVPSGQPGAGRWRLAGADSAPAGLPSKDLHDAAWAVRDIQIPRWSSQVRRAPIADAESLVRIMLAVLTRASGSLELATVVAVFAHRFPHALDPAEEPLPEGNSRLPATRSSADPADVVVADEAAEDAAPFALYIHSALSADERRVLPHLNSPIAEQMRALGRGRSQTYQHVSALKARLLAILSEEDEDDRILIMGELLKLCRPPSDKSPDG